MVGFFFFFFFFFFSFLYDDSPVTRYGALPFLQYSGALCVKKEKVKAQHTKTNQNKEEPTYPPR